MKRIEDRIMVFNETFYYNPFKVTKNEFKMCNYEFKKNEKVEVSMGCYAYRVYKFNDDGKISLKAEDHIMFTEAQIKIFLTEYNIYQRKQKLNKLNDYNS